MKASMIALFIAFIACSSEALVVDINGDPVRNGGNYYILPYINITGGGLTLAKTGNETCPLTVKPHPYSAIDINNGLPWTISSPLRIAFIRTNIWVDFSSVEDKVPSCVPLPSGWEIVEEDDGVKYVKISVDGKTVRGVFGIEEYTEIAYKIVFCTSGTDTCEDIGLSSNGLVITDETPLGLVFVTAEPSEDSTTHAISNVLEA